MRTAPKEVTRRENGHTNAPIASSREKVLFICADLLSLIFSLALYSIEMQIATKNRKKPIYIFLLLGTLLDIFFSRDIIPIIGNNIACGGNHSAPREVKLKEETPL